MSSHYEWARKSPPGTTPKSHSPRRTASPCSSRRRPSDLHEPGGHRIRPAREPASMSAGVADGMYANGARYLLDWDCPWFPVAESRLRLDESRTEQEARHG